VRLPGSGKTAFAKTLETQFGAIRLCPDEWMACIAVDLYDEAARAKIEALQSKLAQTLLERGVAIIIEWGTWGRSKRDALRLRAREIVAAVELHYLAAPVDVLYERVKRPGMESPPIQRGDLARWAEIFEEPSSEEQALLDTPSSSCQ
jgi:predicted kinase